METRDQLTYLPHELIIQILLRLPVKSLIRFKCVCKSWFSIISDTHFANSQFQLTAAKQTDRVLLIATFPPHVTRSIDLDLSFDDDSVFYSFNPNFFPSHSRIEIKGSCRGFILFYCNIGQYHYLWNPSTGFHKQIPHSYNLDIVEEKFYGFGYDHSTDDYLMVSMSSGTNSSYWEFFSMRANKWIQIDDGNIHYSKATHDCFIEGSLFNGAIHWFVFRRDLEKDVIVVFDIMERKLLEMHLPDQFNHELRYRGLCVFRGFLSLWAINGRKAEIWVMKEYGMHSSWTKTHVLRSNYYFKTCFSVLSSTKSSDIIVPDGFHGFLKYNDEGQWLWRRSYFNQLYGLCVVKYTESLLSLPGDNLQA